MAELPRRGWTPKLLILLFCGLAGCGSGNGEDRQPTAEEVQRYTAQIDRAEAIARAKAIRESRAKEEVRDRAARARVPAQN